MRFREADRYIRCPIALSGARRTTPPSIRPSALARARHAHAPNAVGKSEKGALIIHDEIGHTEGSDLRGIRRGRRVGRGTDDEDRHEKERRRALSVARTDGTDDGGRAGRGR